MPACAAINGPGHPAVTHVPQLVCGRPERPSLPQPGRGLVGVPHWSCCGIRNHAAGGWDVSELALTRPARIYGVLPTRLLPVAHDQRRLAAALPAARVRFGGSPAALGRWRAICGWQNRRDRCRRRRFGDCSWHVQWCRGRVRPPLHSRGSDRQWHSHGVEQHHDVTAIAWNQQGEKSFFFFSKTLAMKPQKKSTATRCGCGLGGEGRGGDSHVQHQ